MKNCPICNHQFDDNLNLCPACGADYIEASISSIAGGATQSDAAPSQAPVADSFDGDEVLLQTIESELAVLDNLVPPTLTQTFARMASVVWGVATICVSVAAVVLVAPILYIVAAVVAALFFYSMLRRNKSLSKGEADVAVLARIFEDDMSRMKSSFVERESVGQRIDMVRGRIAEAREVIAKSHKSNRGRIAIFIAVASLLFVVGVGALAVAQHKLRAAEAAYEAQPEWVKLRDAYHGSEYDDEHIGGEARSVIIATMLDAGEVAEAEKFFFEEAMGAVGDYECAQLIVKHYDRNAQRAAADEFISKLELRYGSDNQKIRQY